MNGQAGNKVRPQEGMGFVYVIQAIGTGRVKIGYSVEPERRLLDLQTASPFELVLFGKRPGTIGLERVIHSRLGKYRRVGEWFEIDAAECWATVEAEPLPEWSIQIPDNDHVRTALAHLSMLAQTATGEIRQSREQVENRQAWLVQFIITGEGLASEEARALAEIIKAALSIEGK